MKFVCLPVSKYAGWQMDVRNLAIIFGPTLLQLRDDNVIGMVKDMSGQCQTVEAVVLHVSQFLPITFN